MARLLIGNIKGPQGIQGNDGGIGPVGPVGPPGPMGEVDDNTPIEFIEASQRENLESGDAINVLFGKAKKIFSDLSNIVFFTKKYEAPTPETNEYITSITTFKFVARRYGNVVNIAINFNGNMVAHNSDVALLTLPDEYRPKQYPVIVNYITQSGTPMALNINANGVVNIFNNSNDVNGTWICRQSITYIVD